MRRTLVSVLIAAGMAASIACNTEVSPTSTPSPTLETSVAATQIPTIMPTSTAPDLITGHKKEIYAMLDDTTNLQLQGRKLALDNKRPYLSPTLLDPALAGRISEINNSEDLGEIRASLDTVLRTEIITAVLLLDVHAVLNDTEGILKMNVPECPSNAWKFETHFPPRPPSYGALRTDDGIGPIAFYLGRVLVGTSEFIRAVDHYKIEALRANDAATDCLKQNKPTPAQASKVPTASLHQQLNRHMYGKNNVPKPQYAPRTLRK